MELSRSKRVVINFTI